MPGPGKTDTERPGLHVKPEEFIGTESTMVVAKVWVWELGSGEMLVKESEVSIVFERRKESGDLLCHMVTV